MKLKLLSTVAIFATVTNAVLAQKDDHVPKPTLADAQTVVQTISNDKAKLQAYCELGKLEDQIEKAEEANDAKTVEALFVKSDALAQQIGSEYLKIVDGLADVDPKSAEGAKFAAVFNALHDKCK
jgi:hypothetical protein